MLDVVHQDQPLSLLGLFFGLLLGLHLARVQKVGLLLLLLSVHESDGNLLFEEPLVCPLEIVRLVRLVFRIYHLPEHILQATE